MLKLLSYPLSIVFYICFGLTLLIFHPIQWICLNLFGYYAHKKSVDSLQFFLMRCTNILGTRYRFENPYNIDKNQPVIIVANHQSMFDIPPIIWFMRKHHPKFISKKSLGKGIPSVSFNLKHGGSALIDRKNPKEAVHIIQNFSNYIKNNNRAATIFPEGTRSRTGKPKPFQKKGLITLFEGIPNATVVPITINNSWKLFRYGNFPMGLGTLLSLKVHKPIKVSDFDNNSLVDHLENIITQDIII